MTISLKYRQIIPPGFSHTSKTYKIENQYFILIPKNGSNTVLYGPEKEITIDPLPSTPYEEYVHTFIRDPLNRFAAGLIESVKRTSNFNKTDTFINPYSVPVSKDIYNIYNDFYDKLIDNPKKTILDIILILRESFFDPHLCPQIYFFTDLNYKTVSNLKLYDLSNMESVMKDLGLPIRRSYNTNSSFDTEDYNYSNRYNNKIRIHNLKKILKTFIKNKIDLFDRELMNYYHSLNFIPHKSSTLIRKPVFNLITFSDWLEIKSILLNVISSDDEIRSHLGDLYKADFSIFEQIKRNGSYTIPRYTSLVD